MCRPGRAAVSLGGLAALAGATAEPHQLAAAVTTTTTSSSPCWFGETKTTKTTTTTTTTTTSELGSRAAQSRQQRRQHKQHRGMRRFARRRRALAVLAAMLGGIGGMGRSARSARSASSSAPPLSELASSLVKVHYRRLVDEEQQQQQQQQPDSRAKQPNNKPSRASRGERQQQQQQQQQQPPTVPMSYCCCRCGHTQKLRVEELNGIVGDAFRMAYVAQLQRQPMLQDAIDPLSARIRRDERLQPNSPRGRPVAVAVAAVGRHKPLIKATKGNEDDDDDVDEGLRGGDMNLQLGSANSPTIRLTGVKTPNSIPGLRSGHGFGGRVPGTLHQRRRDNDEDDEDEDPRCAAAKTSRLSQQSTPSSDESNSPTELNTYKRLADKPPLIKRLAMGFNGGRESTAGVNSEDDSCPLVMSGGSTPTSPTTPTAAAAVTTTTTTTRRPRSGGYVNEAVVESDSSCSSNSHGNGNASRHYGKLAAVSRTEVDARQFGVENDRLAQNSPSLGGTPTAARTRTSTVDWDFKSKRRAQQQKVASSSSSSDGGAGQVFGSTVAPTPPPLPERYDSLSGREEGELRRAPWFQAGIPREITLEVLSQEPEGAFMVRESTSKPGCYALSLRVPREFQPSGIAHYLIMRTNKGYKIKGFTKEFTTLTALITHHSVMPELLPCPLSLSRYSPSLAKADSSSKDFADIDSDPDCNALADFRKMMADLNV